MGRVVSYNEDVPRCTFCGKTEHQVRKLVAGPNASICDECIALCVDIISEERVKDAEVNSLSLPKPRSDLRLSQPLRHWSGERQARIIRSRIQPLQARQHGASGVR